MANTVEIKAPKTHKFFFATQISLRVMAFASTLAAACIMLTNKQTAVVFDIQVDARYTYLPAFMFFGFANVIACVFSIVALILTFILGNNPEHYLYIFLHDLIMSELLMAGCAAATAVGYIGKYGNTHTGWTPVCDHFAKFCNRGIAAVLLSFLSIAFYLILTIISAKKWRQIQL
ncbi:hypothetical protein RD792_008844 [Penstemon davidsonii]|uniref:CASP-like protein n=1 Tax=Penstemon davidsonii TaxID=160366 RepID=A0ABR0DB27_9LAMI|nr:hypothetical protein RD792_008840 [Penstemon davidsonii]KAK4486175.1 hypothetical protein RD792_008844 [Penstemon davidsonii]